MAKSSILKDFEYKTARKAGPVRDFTSPIDLFVLCVEIVSIDHNKVLYEPLTLASVRWTYHTDPQGLDFKVLRPLAINTQYQIVMPVYECMKIDRDTGKPLCRYVWEQANLYDPDKHGIRKEEWTAIEEGWRARLRKMYLEREVVEEFDNLDLLEF